MDAQEALKILAEALLDDEFGGYWRNEGFANRLAEALTLATGHQYLVRVLTDGDRVRCFLYTNVPPIRPE